MFVGIVRVGLAAFGCDFDLIVFWSVLLLGIGCGCLLFYVLLVTCLGEFAGVSVCWFSWFPPSASLAFLWFSGVLE